MRRHLAKLRNYNPRHFIFAFFLKKQDFYFYTTILLLFGLLYTIYSQNLLHFALTVAEFLPQSNITANPATLLTQQFTCTTGNPLFTCATYIPVFLSICLLTELFVVYKIGVFIKKIKKRYLLTYSFLMQILPLGAICLFIFAAYRTVGKLSIKANNDIKQAVITLSNTYELDQAGILYTADTISAKLFPSELSEFSLVEFDPKPQAILQFLKVPPKQKTSFYHALILPQQINQSPEVTSLAFGILLFPNQTLVIDRISKPDIEILTPLIAQKMLHKKYAAYLEKTSTPKTFFLNEYEYVIHQTKKEEEAKQEIQKYISDLTTYFEQEQQAIHNNQQIIDNYPTDLQKAQRDLDTFTQKWKDWYENCRLELGNDSVCEEGKQKFDESIQKLQANINFIETNKKNAEEYLQQQISDKKNLTAEIASAQQLYADLINNPITADYQDGVFNPPNETYVRFYDHESRSLTFYLQTVLHEYLHYYSFEENGELPTFLNEGLTDFLKIEASVEYVSPDQRRINYADEIQIAQLLFQKFGQDALLKLYFQQDASALRQLFMSSYPETTYEQFMKLGDSLFFTSLDDTQQRQKLVSEITHLLEQK